ncbi:MAG: PA14 domain-containing protein [Planctomycetota bacterium]
MTETLEQRRLLDSALAGHWQFDESTGTIATNAVAGSTGSLINMEDVDRVDGRFNNGLRFDGVNEYVLIDNVVTGPTFSHSLWVRPEPTVARQGLLSHHTNGVSPFGYSVESGLDLYLEPDNTVSVWIRDGQGASFEFESAISLPDNQWNHIAITNDGSETALWINGQKSTVRAGVEWDMPASEGGFVTVGRARTQGNPIGTAFFKGTIDDVKIYKQGISGGEIKALANPEADGKFRWETTLYTVDEDAGTVTVPVIRIDGSNGAAVVNYEVVDASAKAGLDYTDVTGTVNFADGQVRANVVIPILNDTEVEGDETFNTSLNAVAGPGALDAPRTTTVVIQDDEPQPVGEGDGLQADYFRDTEFNDLAFTRIDPRIDFEWEDNKPEARLNEDNFSVRWTGTVKPLYTETYTFHAEADDGVRLWVDGQLLINQPSWTAADEYTGTINLQAGQEYDLRMEFIEGSGWAKAKLSWSSARQAKEIVPRSQLFTPDAPPTSGTGDGLRGLYYDGQTFSDLQFERIDATVDFEWQAGGPDSRVGVDQFSVRWLGQIEPLYTEEYTFHVQADDGVTLKVNGQTLIDQPEWTPATEYIGTITLEAGQRYDISLDYNEGGGWAQARLFWSSASQPKQIVPQSQLYSVDAPEPPASGSGDGLLGTYFDDNTFTNDVFERVDQRIDFGWQDGSPRADIPADNFSVVWSGFIEPRYGETYTFHLSVDDAAELFVDGVKIIDVPSWTPAPEYTGQITLVEGQQVPIELRFRENTGWASASLSWSSSSQSKEVVPQSQLYSGSNGTPIGTGTGLLGQYFDNRDFTRRKVLRVDETIDFDFGIEAPVPTMGVNDFSIRWDGQVEPRTTGTWTFRTESDDGVRLWVDGNLIINQWVDQAYTAHQGQISLEAGVKYDIRVEYYEAGGQSAMRLLWQGPNTPLEVIPSTQLYPAETPPAPTAGDFVLEDYVTGLTQPTAIDHTSDGWMFIAEKSGIIKLFKDGQVTQFADLRDDVNNVRDRGLIGFAVHPDFPQQPYVYAAYTYDPPEANGNTLGLAGRDERGNRPSRVVKLTATAESGFEIAEAGSGEVIVGKNSTWEHVTRPDLDSTQNFDLPPSGQNPDGTWVQDFLGTDSQSHSIGALRFGTDGALYISNGDGTSYGAVDPRSERVQDLDNLSGKLLRVDPLTGRGFADNPFFDGDLDSNRSKVFALGLRNPYRMAIHPETNDIFLGDVGWGTWEEINVVDFSDGGGENFGWPWYEGADSGNDPTRGYRDLPAAQEFYLNNSAIVPLWSGRHGGADGAVAVTAGDFYTGETNYYPDLYENAFFFTDYGRNDVRAMILNPDGSVNSIESLTDPEGRLVMMDQGIDGAIYVVDINGRIRRLGFES